MRHALLAVVVSLSLVGCGARGAQVAVAVDDAMHDKLASVDDALDARCDSGKLEPPTCQQINAYLVPLWDSYLQINRALRNGAVISDLPAQVRALRTNVEALMALLQKNVADGKTLLEELQDVYRAYPAPTGGA